MDPKALLDELMGKERNVPLTERSNRRIRYDDPAVCKYDLAGICPHGLFKNTRSDLGPCQYETHSDHIEWESIKADYEKQDDREKERYEKKLMRYLEDLIREMDRKIAKSKDRAEKESAPKPIRAEDQVRLDELQQRAKDAVTKSQQLGEEGDVDAAMMLTQQADAYKKQHEELYKRLSAPDRTMTVCDICGVFINSTDNDERRWDHLNGKQYLGWKAIREQYAALQEKYSRGGAAPPAEDGERAGPRERERSPRREEPRRDERYRRDDRPREGRGNPREERGGYREEPGYRDDRGGYERDYRGGGYERDYRGRGSEVAPPRDLYPSRGSSGRDRYYEERRRY